MKRFFLLLTGTAFLVTAVVPALAETVKGEVVEMSCFTELGQNGTGEEHVACALRCVRGGESLGILTDAGVYVIIGEMAQNYNAKLLDYIGKNVEATGVLGTDHGYLLIEVVEISVKSAT